MNRGFTLGLLAVVAACSSFGSDDSRPLPSLVDGGGAAEGGASEASADADADAAPGCSRAATAVGVLDPAAHAFTLYLSSGATRAVSASVPDGALPIAGHWDGGSDSVGWFDAKAATFTLVAAPANIVFGYGVATYVPLAGDWDGDGNSTAGVFDPATNNFFLANKTGNSPASDYQFSFGAVTGTARPVSGDWTGKGKPGVGVFYPETGAAFLADELRPGAADHTITTAHKGSSVWPVAGDWLGCGHDTLGLFDQTTRTFYLLDANETGAHETSLVVADVAGLLPIAGAWPP